MGSPGTRRHLNPSAAAVTTVNSQPPRASGVWRSSSSRATIADTKPCIQRHARMAEVTASPLG